MSYKEFLSGIDTFLTVRNIKSNFEVDECNDVGNVKVSGDNLETIATIEDIHVRVAKQLKVVNGCVTTKIVSVVIVKFCPPSAVYNS